MKVTEKTSDRIAEAHLLTNGRVFGLDEYGEYVDANDNAVCCYVPVEQDNRLKLECRFWGTTKTIVYDAFFDGVLRKSAQFTPNNVSLQKNKRAVLDTFLYKTDEGIIDTTARVMRLAASRVIPGSEAESVSTIELRLYVFREQGVSFFPQKDRKGGELDSNDQSEQVKYQKVKPSFRIGFDEVATPLEKAKAMREQNKLESARPGNEPWAIFRFHYRSIESIEEKKLERTWNNKQNKHSEPRELKLSPVPELIAHPKTAKQDEDTSSRASSHPPPDSPAVTQDKGHSTERPNKFPLPQKDQSVVPQSAGSPMLKSSIPIGKKAPVAPKMTGSAEASRKTSVQPENSLKIHTAKPVRTTATTVTSGKVPSPSKDSTTKAKTALTNLFGGPLEEAVNDVEKLLDTDTIEVAIPKKKSNRITDDVPKKPSDSNTLAEPGSSVVKPYTQPTKETDKSPQAKELSIPKLASTIPSLHVSQQKQPAVAVVIPKRTAEPTDGTIPEVKRPKITTTPPALNLTSPTKLARLYSGSPSPSPRTKGIEHQVAEQRKKLEALRQKRRDMAKKQDEIDQKMEPYKKRMADELERLQQEMMEEEVAAAEDEENFKASVEMLAEFEEGDDNEGRQKV